LQATENFISEGLLVSYFPLNGIMSNINLETLFFQNFVPILLRDGKLSAHFPPPSSAEEDINLPELPDDLLGGNSFLLGASTLILNFSQF